MALSASRRRRRHVAQSAVRYALLRRSESRSRPRKSTRPLHRDRDRAWAQTASFVRYGVLSFALRRKYTARDASTRAFPGSWWISRLRSTSAIRQRLVSVAATAIARAPAKSARPLPCGRLATGHRTASKIRRRPLFTMESGREGRRSQPARPFCSTRPIGRSHAARAASTLTGHTLGGLSRHVLLSRAAK